MPRDPILVGSLAGVVATSDHAIYSERLDGTVTSWNRGAERLFGYPAAMAIGQGADRLYPGHAGDELSLLRRRIHAGEVVEAYEFEGQRQDGLVIPVVVTARPICPSGEDVVGMWVTVRDASEQRTAQTTLAESAARLEEAQALAHIGIWAWDAVSDSFELSSEFHRICGLSPREFDGTFDGYVALVHAEERERVVVAMRLVVATRREFEQEYRIVRPDGGVRWVYVRGEPATDSTGQAVGMRGIAQDVTERKDAEDGLKRQAASLELLKRLAVAANEALSLDTALSASLSDICAHTGWSIGRVYLASATGREAVATPFWYVDSPAYESFRRETADLSVPRGVGLAGRVLATCMPAWTTDLSDGDLGMAAGPAAAAGLHAAFAFPIHVGDEVVAVLEFFSTEAVGPDDQLLEVMATASTQLGRVVERDRAKELLSDQATHDALTGLPNRGLFLARMEDALAIANADGTNVAVLFMDLDGFKIVNDGLGHAAGDAVLVALARRIQTVLKPTDTVARFGGDEFTILCRGLRGEADVLGVVRRVADTVAQPLTLAVGGEVVITCSIGIAFGPKDADGAEGLLRNADAAMYHAKRQGRARYEIFNTLMHTEAIQRLNTVGRLRHAIDQDELRLFYQPQYSLIDGSLTGAEALIRWQRPEEGLALPDEFIQLAEESQLIVPIGAWVLGEACRQAVKWESDQPFEMAVNVSACQLARPDLVRLVDETLRETGADPMSLCLEITESVLMGDAEFYMEALMGLKELGVSIAVDDFGMGYSSLAYLQRFPVDILKVDRAFVSRLGQGDVQGQAIVGAVINLAHALDMTAVAEGVETAEQRQDLIDLGCNVAQGYFFGHPQPVGARSAWHPKGNRRSRSRS